MSGINIYAIIATEAHDINIVNPGNSVLIRAKNEEEQQVIMREIALAVMGDVVKLSNGMYMIVTAVR
ncbi:hypothetical protein LSG31_09335 [Fodinisporobacter ferrooxydans]|uniref:Uncharacterized protein n=1 Tax=Fodinisporobacter ferrooxydans TaxID=2901836 RepID=A0ABY4CRU3_9BACL|nr:hypothetical protein LSG31_09335 [Alicyclobacillaceae bacterium MYW30-H2]